MSACGVIDFRVQPPYGSLLDMHFFRDTRGDDDPDTRLPFGADRARNPSKEERSIDLFLTEMEAAGIEHSVIVGQRASEKWGIVANDDISALVKDHPGRFTGFAGIDPSEADAVELVSRAVELQGLRGVSLLPGWNEPPLADDDPAVMRVYERCVALGAPVIVTASHYIGRDMNHSHPVHLQHVVEAFPELTLIVGHGSWPWTTAATALAMRYPNVYLMPEFYMYTPNMPGAADYVAAANSFLMERTLYSSCYPSRALGEAIQLFRALPLSDDAQEHAMRLNGRRLLGLD